MITFMNLAVESLIGGALTLGYNNAQSKGMSNSLIGAGYPLKKPFFCIRPMRD